MIGKRMMNDCCREVYTVWCARVGPASRLLPADQVHSLLYEMQLYPTQAQGKRRYAGCPIKTPSPPSLNPDLGWGMKSPNM